MPKKFANENSKAIAAKCRKADQLAMEKAIVKKLNDDAYWEDENKHVLKKNLRKEKKEEKREGVLSRKKENKAMEEEEKSTLSTPSYNAAPNKVTAHQLQTKREANKPEEPKVLSHLEMPLFENTNKEIETVQASGITEALKALNVEDALPKMSMAAAFKAFHAEKLAELKKKKPQLKLSQLEDLIRKEWKRSPQNPQNRR